MFIRPTVSPVVPSSRFPGPCVSHVLPRVCNLCLERPDARDRAARGSRSTRSQASVSTAREPTHQMLPDAGCLIIWLHVPSLLFSFSLSHSTGLLKTGLKHKTRDWGTRQETRTKLLLSAAISFLAHSEGGDGDWTFSHYDPGTCCYTRLLPSYLSFLFFSYSSSRFRFRFFLPS